MEGADLFSRLDPNDPAPPYIASLVNHNKGAQKPSCRGHQSVGWHVVMSVWHDQGSIRGKIYEDK